MPIAGLSDRRRLPRLLKIRLGVRRNGGNDGPPKEVDYFVFKKEDGATDEILKLYGGHPKAIRMMLPFEVDAADPKTDDEIVWNENNRAYGRAHGLKCKGHGGSASEASFAETDDEAWAKRIVEVTKGQPEVLANGRFRIPCWGRDCPKYHLVDDQGKKLPGHDPDAACRAVVVLRAFLLHPTDDPESPDYCRVLGVAEIASGSRNTMVDVRSSFEVLRLYTGGRTSAVPFKLIRRPMRTTSTGPLHYTLTIEPTPKEWQTFGMTPPSQVFLPAAKRAELQALAGEVSFDSVRDLLPRALPPATSIPPESPAGPEEEAITGDRDQAVADALGEPADGVLEEISEEALNTALDKTARDELKELCGSTPGDASTMGPFRAWVARAYDEFDTWAVIAEQLPNLAVDRARPPFDFLTVRHYRWLKEAVREAARDRDPDDVVTPQQELVS